MNTWLRSNHTHSPVLVSKGQVLGTVLKDPPDYRQVKLSLYDDATLLSYPLSPELISLGPQC